MDVGGSCATSFPFPLESENPFRMFGVGDLRCGGAVEKGRVSNRSAREYWCVRKNVCASQNASLGSSVRSHICSASTHNNGRTHWSN